MIDSCHAESALDKYEYTNRVMKTRHIHLVTFRVSTEEPGLQTTACIQQQQSCLVPPLGQLLPLTFSTNGDPDSVSYLCTTPTLVLGMDSTEVHFQI